jgi:SAM-dependent methyltransferase
MQTASVPLYAQQPDLVREINRLWFAVYPHLARQVADACASEPASILEVGCFSGGVGCELLRIFPRAHLSIALDMPQLAATFSEDWPGCDEDRVRVIQTPLTPLNVSETYDLVFCRGAFFFFDETASIMQEFVRVLASGGMVFFGGGYGCYTPDALIAPIAGESRIKNDALGRRMYSIGELQRLIDHAGLADRARICESGGLWVVLNG